jgi:DNA-binding transcriptional ArsR family regulator
MLGFDDHFKALADPTRRAILAELRAGPLHAGKLAERLGLSASALSFHLKVLKNSDLVATRRDGQFIEYRLNTSVVDELIGFLVDRLGPDATPTKEEP